MFEKQITSPFFWNGFLSMLFIVIFVSSSNGDEIMDRIKKTGAISIGFQEDVAPFSWFDRNSGQYMGFSVDMATELVKYLSKRFGKPIRLKAVNLKASQRIEMLIQGIVDIEMGASTQTLKREELVDFSLVFFSSETTFMVAKSSGIKDVQSLNGINIAVGKGTTNQLLLRQMADNNILSKVKILTYETHDQAMQAIVTKQVDAYCADRVLLTTQIRRTPNPADWLIIEDSIGYEPYGYMVPEGNSDFRDFINNTIRWSILSGRYFDIYKKWMGPLGIGPYKMPLSFKEYLTVIAYSMDDDWWKE